MYDPLHARSVCISGQLYLLELANHLYRDIPGLRVVELNTDGCQVEFDDQYLEDVRAIVHEWEERTHFGMEEEDIQLNVSKDVNNYVQIITGENDVKVKGGMLVRGISTAGAFKINNNLVIVAEALRDYLVLGIDPVKHIMECNDMMKFQMIAKASSKYSAVYHIKNGERVKVQKCNRVYASRDPTDGTLIKISVAKGNDNKVAGLPEHCFIDNKNTHSIDEVDKQWYVNLCKEQIQAFLGYDPFDEYSKEKNIMAEKQKNVFQKLMEARIAFLAECVKKSGKNMNLAYKYFELEDIVPVATRIFNRLDLIALVSFNNETAEMRIVNLDNPDERIYFFSPMREIEPITTKSGAVVANALQRLGSVETYQRRYLYMVALDIVEADEMEAQTGAKIPDEPKASEPATPAVEPAPARKPIPVKKAEQRAEIKQELTNTSGAANDLQKEQLKKVMTELLGKNKSFAPIINDILTSTDGLKNLTAADCEKLLTALSAKLGE